MQYLMNDTELLEFFISHPFAGGEGEGEGEGGGSSVVEGDPGDRSGSSPDRGRDSGQWIPKHRFDEVNSKFREAEAFRQQLQKLGLTDFQSIQALKQRADELGKDRRFTDSEKENLRKELDEVAPELREYREWRESQKAANYQRGEERVNKMLSEIGLEANKRNNFLIQEMLSFELKQEDNRNLLVRFRSGDLSTLDEVWPKVKKLLNLGAAKRQADARVQSIKQGTTQPKLQKKEGEDKLAAGAAGATPMRDALNDAGDRAFAMLEALDEE